MVTPLPGRLSSYIGNVNNTLRAVKNISLRPFFMCTHCSPGIKESLRNFTSLRLCVNVALHMILLEAESLSKNYGTFKAVDDLSFSVPEGSVYGFLGENGAGKSTTIRMLLTLVQPDSGSVRMLGKNLLQHREELLRHTGAVIEKPDLYKYLTAYQNIRMMAQWSGIHPSKKRLMQKLGQVGLADRAHSLVKTYSQGMKQRLGIACALVHDPKLIILDEPTNGLDPQGIADMRQLILHLSRDEGKTIIVSSHLLSEIEVIADSMLIIHKGKKIVEGKVSTLLAPSETILEIHTRDDAAAIAFLQGTQWSGGLEGAEEGIRLKLHPDEMPQLLRALLDHGIHPLSVTPRHSLEDYFLSLTRQPHVVTGAH